MRLAAEGQAYMRRWKDRYGKAAAADKPNVDVEALLIPENTVVYEGISKLVSAAALKQDEGSAADSLLWSATLNSLSGAASKWKSTAPEDTAQAKGHALEFLARVSSKQLARIDWAMEVCRVILTRHAARVGEVTVNPQPSEPGLAPAAGAEILLESQASAAVTHLRDDILAKYDEGAEEAAELLRYGGKMRAVLSGKQTQKMAVYILSKATERAMLTAFTFDVLTVHAALAEGTEIYQK